MARLSRLLILGGLAAGAAYARRNKQKVSGLVDSVTPSPSTPAPAPADAPVGTAASTPGPAPAPAVANIDVAGPPDNSATHVPAPEPVIHEPAGGIDEAAEEAAAAAEAANIGGGAGGAIAYPDLDDPTLEADPALRPLEEAGEGWSEGQELAEADLIDNAEPAAGDPLEGGRAIDDAIEAQDDPFSGESGEAIEHGGLGDESETAVEAEALGDAPPPTGTPAVDVPPPPSAEEKSSAVWRLEAEPTAEADKPDGH